MSVEANDLLLFAKVVDCGSFSLAAERVGQPKSTVSRRISYLESELGERLLQRTTRKLVLTEFGASLLEHARQVAEQVDAAGALVQHHQAEPSGRLRISMPADFANLEMGPMLAAFMQRYPAIVVELDLSPRRVDLVAEKFDLAIRMGSLPDDASLVARRIIHVTNGLYAAPDYITRHGMPEHPDKLAQHATLCLRGQTGSTLPWVLTRGKIRWEREMKARMLANSPDLLMRMARTGAGIATSSNHYAAPYVKSGELLRILPDWDLPDSAGWAVFPGRRLMPAKTRVFLDMMEAMFSVGAY
jgi:DNA-binding transcriptional LysR family regulator